MNQFTKKIRFIETLSTAREVFIAGREYDLDMHEAYQAIDANVAVEVVEKPATKSKGKKHALDTINPE